LDHRHVVFIRGGYKEGNREATALIRETRFF
jgi:hypothetical protein